MSPKAVVFAYHDIGCVGLQALLDAGYDIAAVFTHADDPAEKNLFSARWLSSVPGMTYPCMRLKTQTTRCGWNASAN